MPGQPVMALGNTYKRILGPLLTEMDVEGLSCVPTNFKGIALTGIGDQEAIVRDVEGPAFHADTALSGPVAEEGEGAGDVVAVGVQRPYIEDDRGPPAWWRWRSICLFSRCETAFGLFFKPLQVGKTGGEHTVKIRIAADKVSHNKTFLRKAARPRFSRFRGHGKAY